MGLFDQLRGGRFSRTDRPDGLVSENQLLIRRVDALALFDKIAAHRFIACFPNLQRLPDTVDDGKAPLFEPRILLGDERLRLAQNMPSFAVAYQDGVDPELFKLFETDLSRIGAFDGRVGVLRTDTDIGFRLKPVERCRRREDVDLSFVSGRVQTGLERFDVGACRRAGVVGLEVGGEYFTHRHPHRPAAPRYPAAFCPREVRGSRRRPWR